MSHISVTVIELPDLETLQEVLQGLVELEKVIDLQIAQVGQVVSEITDYQGTVEGQFAGKFLAEGLSAQGFAFSRKDDGEAFKFQADRWGRRNEAVDQFLEMVQEHYATTTAINQLSPEGFFMTSSQHEDGELVLEFARL